MSTTAINDPIDCAMCANGFDLCLQPVKCFPEFELILQSDMMTTTVSEAEGATASPPMKPFTRADGTASLCHRKRSRRQKEGKRGGERNN